MIKVYYLATAGRRSSLFVKGYVISLSAFDIVTTSCIFDKNQPVSICFKHFWSYFKYHPKLIYRVFNK